MLGAPGMEKNCCAISNDSKRNDNEQFVAHCLGECQRHCQKKEPPVDETGGSLTFKYYSSYHSQTCHKIGFSDRIVALIFWFRP